MRPLPSEFISQINRMFAPGEAKVFLEAIEATPVTSARLNPFKPSDAFKSEPVVEWCHRGRYLFERPSFITDPLFHAGAYYVQESSSMFLEQVMEKIMPLSDQPMKVLDLCAAPGGKSTLLLDHLREHDLLVSNEIIRSRVQILNENIQRWGRSNVFVTNNDPKDFSKLEHYFDVLLVDAPCSGEGLFRKNPKAAEEWSLANVDLCTGRQQRILADVLPALKPGGFLIYSTCTFNEKENEENVLWLMKEYDLQTVSIPTEANWNVDVVSSYAQTPMNAYHFYPHKVKGEGLFICCLQKRQGESLFKYPTKPEKGVVVPAKKHEAELSKWLKNAEQFEYVQQQQNVFALQHEHRKDYDYLVNKLHIVNAGIRMGELMRDELVPDHALALNTFVSADVQRWDLTKEEALRYLKKDTLSMSQQLSKGWTLVTYEGLALGWVKVLPNRINNYLPTQLRILKDL